MDNEPAASGPPKRGRGRPRKHGDLKDELRRQKNRHAQYLFRVRKQAVQEERILDLEDTIERMGATFINLADFILQSGGSETDTKLAQKLQATMQNVLDLANGTSGTRDNDSRLHESIKTGLGPFQTEDVSRATRDETCRIFCETNPLKPSQLCTQPGPGRMSEPSAAGAAPFPDFLPSNQDTFANNVLTYPVNPINNSWSSAAIESQLEPDPLSFKIVQSTIKHASSILLGTINLPRGVMARNFGPALETQSREDLIGELEWLLGPGYTEMRQMASASFLSPFDSVEAGLSMSCLLDAPEMIQRGEYPGTEYAITDQAFVNADAIAIYLRAKGLRRIDEDIIELFKTQPTVSPTPPAPLSTSGQPSSFLKLDFLFPADSLFQTNNASEANVSACPSRQAVRISLSRFLENLSKVSVCLAYGPGYPREHLDGAICAAVIGRPAVANGDNSVY